ncbi:hypothetical protein ABZU75_10245 [Streptosporangium sp. NPDC005286]|uniref:hypothetical protein n=1 Tax=Streptosporangium sp. NPDC005286 TaxID=3154463 RepID=UPI0033A57519
MSRPTVPAAGYFAVAAALSCWGDMGASAVRLGVNIAGMIISGVLTLLVQRTYRSRFGMRPPVPPAGGEPPFWTRGTPSYD